MPLEVAAKVLGGGVADALLQAHHLHVLGHHVHDQIGGQTLGAVGEPLDQVCVFQSSHPHGPSLVVDLGEALLDLELRHHVRQLTQLPGGQPLGGVLVHHGDLVIGDLLHLRGKVALLNGQQLAVAAGPQHHPGADGAHQDHSDQRHHSEKGDGALLLHKVKVTLGALPLKAGGEHCAHAVHRADQEEEHVQFLGVEVQSGQLEIEVPQGEHQRHRQVDKHATHRTAHGLAGLPGLLRRRRETALLALKSAGIESAGIEPAEIEGKRHGNAPFCLLEKWNP